LGLEIEEQRTNLLLRSEEFDNASWTKTNSSITANTIVAPDGATTADKLIVDNGVAFGSGFTRQNVSKAASAITYTSTVYAKAGEFNRVSCFCRDAVTSANSASVTISLVNGSVVVAAAATGTFTSASSSVTSVGNGWYRIALTFTSGTETTIWGGGYIPSDSVATQGNGFSGIFIWGAQLEAGAFPTSYIQTVASQVTRAADAASMTGTNFSSWYNQAEGSVYAEAATVETGLSSGGAFVLIIAGDTTSNNVHRIFRQSDAQAVMQTLVGGTAQVTFGFGADWTNTNPRKLSYAYKVNDFAGVQSAGAVQTDASGSVPLVDRIFLGSDQNGGTQLNGTIRKIAYYPLRVTNANLQALTS
jgi:hypothetical protein